MKFIEEHSLNGKSTILYDDKKDPHLEMIVREMERLVHISSYLFYKGSSFLVNIKAFQIDNFYFVFSFAGSELTLSIEIVESRKKQIAESNITKDEIMDKIKQIVNGD